MTINKTQELIDVGRSEVALDDARLERNRAGVWSRLAAVGIASAGASVSGAAAASASAATTATASATLTKFVLGAVLVGGSVAGGYAVLSEPEPVSVQAPAQTTPAKVVAPPVAVPEVSEPESKSVPDEPPSVVPEKQRIQAPAQKRPTAADSLASAAKLLAQARAATARGDANEALRLLDAHPEIARGSLGQEWLAAKILVLCRLGRVEQAKALATSFLKRHGDSPLAAQIARSCAGK